MNKNLEHEKKQEQSKFIYGLQGLCEFLDISMKTACSLTKNLPHYRAGRKIFFKEDEILNYMAKNQNN